MSAQLFLFSPNLGASHARSLGSENGGMKDASLKWMFLISKAKDEVPTLACTPFSSWLAFYKDV